MLSFWNSSHCLGYSNVNLENIAFDIKILDIHLVNTVMHVITYNSMQRKHNVGGHFK